MEQVLIRNPPTWDRKVERSGRSLEQELRDVLSNDLHR